MALLLNVLTESCIRIMERDAVSLEDTFADILNVARIFGVEEVGQTKVDAYRAAWVLDEPTNHLDIRHQFEPLELVKGLGVTTLAALHDLNFAAQYCDRVVMLKEGKVFVEGPPDVVLIPKTIREVYAVEAETSYNPDTEKVNITFTGIVNL